MSEYDRLRPWTKIESCECATVTNLLLVDLLTDNPIHCGVCRREVDPERIHLAPDETNSISHWFMSSSALFRLWLHSGEYETYSKERLLDAHGEINVVGRKIARELSAKIPTQLWFFHDTDDGQPVACPVCTHPLNTNVKWGIGQCEKCFVRI